MTPRHRTELVIPAMDRARRVRRVQRALAAVRGVARVELDAQSRRMLVIHELADSLPLVAVLAGLGYAARGVTVEDDAPSEAEG
ncbi:MAG TPA: hypothetical protein VJM14_19070 [Burkholderiales bacterium]|nr:hypothetical protein [Burkholderiales bacterium]